MKNKIKEKWGNYRKWRSEDQRSEDQNKKIESKKEKDRREMEERGKTNQK